MGDEYAVEITSTRQVVETARHDLRGLRQHRANIEAQKARQMAERDAELADVDARIAKIVALGVQERPVAG